MPLLTVRTSVAQPAAAELEDLLLEISGRIASHLGKPEAYVMTAFEGEVPMTFAGSSADLCALIEDRLGVPAARTYIEFAATEGYLWGWNGGTFG